MESVSENVSMKSVYLFHEGDASMKALLGGKGANLAEMVQAGLPVPPGFTITTAVCNHYLENNKQVPMGLWESVHAALKSVESSMNRTFGDPSNPLLVSVRSGAQISMPGMMETILNLGLNDETLSGLVQQSGNERFAYDSYRRFIQMFSTVVLGVDKHDFDTILDAKKAVLNIKHDCDIPTKELMQIVQTYKERVLAKTGKEFPQDPTEQLHLAIQAVFQSWTIPRAVAYRNYNKISHDLGTAVNVQAMVFGNMGADSATGVAFTRNPSTGEKELYGEYLVNAQGEDVVAGIRTPLKIADMANELPDAFEQFSEIAQRLEAHYRDVQDLEFTIEQGRLFMLQTRSAKRTIQAAVKIAVDMATEGYLSRDEALASVEPNQLPQLLLPRFDAIEKEQAVDDKRLLATGLNASPGAATGMIVFDPDEAVERTSNGEKVILTRMETCPDDVHGMIAAQGVLTSRGGNTSHAAVVARGMGKPCVAGCETCQIDLKQQTLTANGKIFKKGDVLSIDGATGEVFEGAIQTVPPEISPEFETLLQWADERRQLGVRANADTPEDAEKAIELGAKGIGLCRTEHMFMAADRLPVVQDMILSDSPASREAALNKLLPMQLDDFKGIFTAMNGHPVTIRLLDPPLHEFLPNPMELLESIHELKAANQFHSAIPEKERLLKKIQELSEANPMMGFRGCRLGLIYPEIYGMQIKAIFEAATDLVHEGVSVKPEIMIPLIGHPEELKRIRTQLESVAEEVMKRKDTWLHYLFGTMIEIPRAALEADKIAEYAEFFSFGTNDLTQLTYGYSRDDAEGRFLSDYVEQGVLPDNPFEVLDAEGVGQLLIMSRDKGRQTRPSIKLGICGEHGGENQSVQFCHTIGLDYVSCSPFRVPVARLAAAQAVIAQQANNDTKQSPRMVAVPR